MFDNKEPSMSMQNAGNEGDDAKGSQQSPNQGDSASADDTTHQQEGGAFSGNGEDGQVRTGTGESGKRGGAGDSSPHASQQPGMPPGQTDDDQYDQGTVKRAT
jgi:hypothetical protein